MKLTASQLAAYTARTGLTAPGATTEAPRNKYGNVRTTWAGITYDSKAEAATAAMLDLMQAAGVVSFWERQVSYALGAGITYRCDFRVHYPAGSAHVIDVKGYSTPAFKLKRKLFEDQYHPLTVIGSARALPTTGRNA